MDDDCTTSDDYAKKKCPHFTNDRCDLGQDRGPHLPEPVEVQDGRQFREVAKVFRAGHKRRDRCCLNWYSPKRCDVFESKLLPSAPRHVVDDYYSAFPGCQAAFRRLEEINGGTTEKVCRDCGQPRQRDKTYCPSCAKRRKRTSKRNRQQRWRRSQRWPVDAKSVLEAPGVPV